MSLRRFALPVLIWSIAISSVAAGATTDSIISSIPNFHQVDTRVFRGGQPLDGASGHEWRRRRVRPLQAGQGSHGDRDRGLSNLARWLDQRESIERGQDLR